MRKQKKSAVDNEMKQIKAEATKNIKLEVQFRSKKNNSGINLIGLKAAEIDEKIHNQTRK